MYNSKIIGMFWLMQAFPYNTVAKNKSTDDSINVQAHLNCLEVNFSMIEEQSSKTRVNFSVVRTFLDWTEF